MRRVALLFLIPAVLPPSSCAPKYVLTERGPQAFYQTGFPSHDTSAELERIFKSVKRVQVTGYYLTHRFLAADSITAAAVRERTTYQKAAERFSFEHTKTGTATVVGLTQDRATLITNEHVTALPDTIIVYYREPTTSSGGGGVSRYVESVSIRTGQRYLAIGVPDNRPFTIVARDKVNDIAAISVQLTGREFPGTVDVLPIRAGDPSRLVWGSFVYVLGYPRGFQMVTRGIVSAPNRTADNGFLLDGLFNRGISGGLIVAVRGDTNALEWVGLATSASAEVEYSLVPERRTIEEDGMLLPYEGRLYLERTPRIDYGITFSVPATAVQRLLRDARLLIPLPATQTLR